VSTNAIANIEVLSTLAIVAVVALANVWPFVRWNRRLRRLGHQSPFVAAGLLCVARRAWDPRLSYSLHTMGTLSVPGARCG
jgi:hypothetical protein